MDPAQTSMVPAGPPVPDNLARAIFSEVSDFTHHVKVQSPQYSRMLADLHPQAKTLDDFLRTKNPLPVGSYNQLRRLASRLRLSHKFVGPKAPHSLVTDLLARLTERGIDPETVCITNERFKPILQDLNHKAVSIADFARIEGRTHLGSHYLLRELVGLAMTPPADCPPVPPHLVREILQPLADRGYDLADFNNGDRRYLKPLRIQSTTAESFADFVAVGAVPIFAHNALRTNVGTILERHVVQERSWERKVETPHRRYLRPATSSSELPAAVKAILSAEKPDMPAPAPNAIAQVTLHLERGGYAGLYRDNCSCLAGDLATCGRRALDDAGQYIAGCRPGNKHEDPAGTGLWVIAENAPNDEDWQRERATWGISVDTSRRATEKNSAPAAGAGGRAGADARSSAGAAAASRPNRPAPRTKSATALTPQALRKARPPPNNAE